MYNRYIPQPDGSHRRNKVSDSTRPEPQHRPAPPPRPEPSPSCQEPERQKHNGDHSPTQQASGSITGFFKNLLPKDLDTGDLLIILLLLLMAGDNEKERNNALLTIALYFFM